MLFVVLLMLAAGGALLYAGIKGGDTWKHPWSPFVDQLSARTKPA